MVAPCCSVGFYVASTFVFTTLSEAKVSNKGNAFGIGALAEKSRKVSMDTTLHILPEITNVNCILRQFDAKDFSTIANQSSAL